MKAQVAESGAQPGNDNYRKGRLVADAVRKVAIQNPEMLHRAVMSQLRQAEAGDLPALVFIRDTLDGKPVQSIAADDGDGVPFQAIRIIVVKPDTIPIPNVINGLTLEHDK